MKLLSLAEVIEITGLSNSTIWRQTKLGQFPKKARISKGRVAWDEAEIQKWVQQKFSKTK